MSPVILPTHTCFDDALDYIERRVLAHPSIGFGTSLLLVHGICYRPDDVPFAHGWVEDAGVVWDAGLIEGRRVWFAVNREEYYAKMRITDVTRYTMREVWVENTRSGNYGPWKPEYLALCRGVVHVLHAGRALCGRRGTPNTWSEDERWVGLADRAQSTCPRCRQA